jgi:N-acetylglucosaminyl-diphospho-decaprenol L-rhamnosyltransferase
VFIRFHLWLIPVVASRDNSPTPDYDSIMPDLSLILITHNSARWLTPFITSWEATLRNAPELTTELILADAGSTDDTLHLAQTIRPDATLLPLPNVGFGAAANAATKAAQSPWILLCNPDLTFSPLFAAALLAPLLASDASIPWSQAACIAPQLLNPDGTIQPSIGRFPTVRSLLADQLRPREQRKYISPQPTAPTPVDWATGACLLLLRHAFLEVGGFDEKFFLYVEEVDLQRRFRDAGHPTWFVPLEGAAITHHHPNAARSPRPEVLRWSARGLLRYFAKHQPLSLSAYRLLALLTGRLPPSEALAPRQKILQRPTGPSEPLKKSVKSV